MVIYRTWIHCEIIHHKYIAESFMIHDNDSPFCWGSPHSFYSSAFFRPNVDKTMNIWWRGYPKVTHIWKNYLFPSTSNESCSVSIRQNLQECILGLLWQNLLVESIPLAVQRNRAATCLLRAPVETFHILLPISSSPSQTWHHLGLNSQPVAHFARHLVGKMAILFSWMRITILTSQAMTPWHGTQVPYKRHPHVSKFQHCILTAKNTSSYHMLLLWPSF